MENKLIDCSDRNLSASVYNLEDMSSCLREYFCVFEVQQKLIEGSERILLANCYTFAFFIFLKRMVHNFVLFLIFLSVSLLSRKS